jgi:hypothetical protein
MSLRSWVIRGLILTGLAAIAALVWVANSWVSPDQVRAEVLKSLYEQFDGIEIQVGSARMRILGGIAVTDLKLIRKGTSGDSLVLSVPSAVLYHDKEQLSHGHLIIKKIVLDNPELNLERSSDGKWNVAGIFKEGPADKPVPTFVIEGGTVHIVDRSKESIPETTLNGVRFTLLNEPIPVLEITASATTKGLGPIIALGRLNRITGVLSLVVKLSEVPLGELAAANVDRIAPGLSQHLVGLTAKASVVADLTFTPDAAKKWQHDVKVELKDARYVHPDLPWPVENINASLSIEDGLIKIKDASAHVAGANIKLSLISRVNDTATLQPTTSLPDDALKRLENHLIGLDLSINGLALDDVLFRILPSRVQIFRQQFSPIGQVDLSYKFTREKAGWTRELELRPKQITMTYEHFKYPVSDVRGWIKKTQTHNGDPTTDIDLLGTASGQTITIKGQITGEGEDPGVNLRVIGTNVPIDEKLFAAFPPKYADMVQRFRAVGRGDFVAKFVQAPGVNLCENEFNIVIQNATICHVEFPYPLEKVKGRLTVRVAANDPHRPIHAGEALATLPDRDEIILDEFTAVHAGSTLYLNGTKRPVPGSHEKKLVLQVSGSNCPVDEDLRAICRVFKLDSVWTTFNPRGKLTFTVNLDLIEHFSPGDPPNQEPKFNPMTDLNLTFTFSGASVTPTFFRYELSDFSGWLEYKGGRVELARFAARHGESRVRLASGETWFYPDGTVFAKLQELEVRPLIVDEAFINAMPKKLGSGVEVLKLKGEAELSVKELVVLTPPDLPGKDKTDPNAPSPSPGPRSQTFGGGEPAIQNVGLVSVGNMISPRTPFQGSDGSNPSSRSNPGQLPSMSTTPAQPDPVVYWNLVLTLTGASFDTGVAWEKAFGSVQCTGRYDSTHVGPIRGSLWFDKTAIAGQPLTRISGRFGATPQQPDPSRMGEYFPTELAFTDLQGELFHGIVGGEARVALTTPVRFNLWLKAADVQLDEVAKHFKLGTDADLKGIAQAQLRLHNRLDSLSRQMLVEGWGSIDVPTGSMYNLPILLDLLKLLTINPLDKTAFEEAHANFRIQGDRVKVDQIDLIGKAVCLGGSGEFDVTGNYVKFDFYTIISQVLAKLINTPVGDLTAFLSRNLFVIKLTRENGELKYKPEAVPLVSEPAQEAADRLRVRVSKMFGGK